MPETGAPQDDLANAVAAGVPGAVTTASTAFGETAITVVRERILDVLRFLRDDPGMLFINLTDITAVDYPVRAERFEVLYQMLSPRHNRRVRVKTDTDPETPIDSAVGLFPVANWYEREVYDLFGVFFTGHPDLRRILTDYGFDGHPLRKDFPMTGYVEVRYDDQQKRVVYEPVRLNQEYRSFDFLSPWEGSTPYTLPGDEKARTTIPALPPDAVMPTKGNA